MQKTDYNVSMTPIETNKDGQKFNIKITVPAYYGWMDDMSIKIQNGNRQIIVPLKFKVMENDMVTFEGEVSLGTRAIYRYYCECEINGCNVYFLKNGATDNINEIVDNTYKVSVNFEVPEWAQGKVMYHIFVDRFARGSKEPLDPMKNRRTYNSFYDEMELGPDSNGVWNNDFYGGDLKGITKHLDYIESLGVSILYLSPIVESQSNHRYDTADYMRVDPYAGCNEDLRELCDEAHKRGMKVVLDAVFNHTGNDSKYFNQFGTYDTEGAYNNPNSPYSSFYRKHNYDNHVYYDYWWGMQNLPVCDGNSKTWQDFIYGENGVIDLWFSLGIDGLRLDVADELSDNFIEGIRRAVKRNKEDGFILGEVWKNPMRMNRGYIESGRGMDSVMDYSLIDALIRYFKYNDVTKLSYIIKDILREYPDQTIKSLMNFSSTHDITRAINIFSYNNFQENTEWAWNVCHDGRDLEWFKHTRLGVEEYKRARDVYEAYMFALYFMPGIVSIFYGDEIGIQGLGNLANRKPFLISKGDMELLKYFRYLGKIRKDMPFLEQADLSILDINSKYMMFERESPEGKALIAVNRTNDEVDIPVPSEYIKNDGVYTLKKSLNNKLNPFGGVAIKKN